MAVAKRLAGSICVQEVDSFSVVVTFGSYWIKKRLNTEMPLKSVLLSFFTTNRARLNHSGEFVRAFSVCTVANSARLNTFLLHSSFAHHLTAKNKMILVVFFPQFRLCGVNAALLVGQKLCDIYFNLLKKSSFPKGYNE